MRRHQSGMASMVLLATSAASMWKVSGLMLARCHSVTVGPAAV